MVCCGTWEVVKLVRAGEKAEVLMPCCGLFSESSTRAST